MSLNNEALQAAYLGEVGGQRFFLALAEQFEESAAALHVLARLENHIGKRMASLLQRRGLPAGNAEAAALQAEKYARTWRTLDWYQALARMEAEILPFIPQYDLLAEHAGVEDKDDLETLAAHERALLLFTRVARQGRQGEALSHITRLLQEIDPGAD